MKPGMYSEQGYVGAKAIVEALNAMGGKAEDTEAFLAALRKVSFAAPRGPFKFDANRNVIENVYICDSGNGGWQASERGERCDP